MTNVLTRLTDEVPSGWDNTKNPNDLDANGKMKPFTWNSVPGMYDKVGAGNMKGRIIVATDRNDQLPAGGPGRSHGSANLVFHELAHGLDGVLQRLNDSDGFKDGFIKARQADIDALNDSRDPNAAARPLFGDDYYAQTGRRGLEESYAESFARFLVDDPNDKANYENLWLFWSNESLMRRCKTC
jgi:hypothetical protein